MAAPKALPSERALPHKCFSKLAEEHRVRKGLLRFDSATHFSKHKPTACTSDVSGNLRTLRAQETEVRTEARADLSTHGVSTTNRELGLRVLTQVYAGNWAMELTGNEEFSQSITSGLSRLAAVCGSAVTSRKRDKTDPWALAACLSESERQAMAAIVAELLLSEMNTLARAKSRVNHQIASRARAEELGNTPRPQNGICVGSGVAAVPLAPRPPAGRKRSNSGGPRPAVSRTTPAVTATRPATAIPGHAPSHIGFGARNLIEKAPIAEGPCAPFLPPSKEFWKSLATSGMSLRTSKRDTNRTLALLPEIPAQVASPNSITTA